MTLALCLAGIAQAQKYDVTVLPKLKGGTFATATAINNVDQIVGSADDASGFDNAVIWENGQVTALVPGNPLGSVAIGINDSGVVVGESVGAFVWSPTFLYLSGRQVSGAEAINAHGEIIGTQGPVPGVWLSPSMINDSITPPAPPAGYDVFDLYLTALNDSGVLVGTVTSEDDPTIYRATRWSSLAADAKVKDLGTLGGKASQPNAVNDREWVVGWAALYNGEQHAALWEPDTTAYDLGTLGGKNSVASGINLHGDVVGSAQTAGGAWHAVLWTSKHFKPVDLNIEISPAVAKTITLVDAVGTNSKCRIVVNGIDRKSGADEAFLLTPTDPSSCVAQ